MLSDERPSGRPAIRAGEIWGGRDPLDRFSDTWAARGEGQKTRVRRGRRGRLPHWFHDQERSTPHSDTGEAED